MKKLKLLPTLKEKRHYLVLITKKNEKEIEKALLDFLGILNYARANPMIVEKGKTKSKFYFILAVTTKYVNAVKAALALTKDIRCVGVSGTIKKAKKKFLSKETKV